MEIGKKLQNGLWAVYHSLTLGPVAGYHVSLVVCVSPGMKTEDYSNYFEIC